MVAVDKRYFLNKNFCLSSCSLIVRLQVISKLCSSTDGHLVSSIKAVSYKYDLLVVYGSF